MVHYKLKEINATFFTYSIDIRGNETPISINALVKVLKNHEYKNENVEIVRIKNEEKEKLKYFQLCFLSSANWTIDMVHNSI